jgi:hypothetical protein
MATAGPQRSRHLAVLREILVDLLPLIPMPDLHHAHRSLAHLPGAVPMRSPYLESCLHVLAPFTGVEVAT